MTERDNNTTTLTHIKRERERGREGENLASRESIVILGDNVQVKVQFPKYKNTNQIGSKNQAASDTFSETDTAIDTH